MTTDKSKSTSTTPSEQRMMYVSLGVVFLGLAVTLSVTLQNMAMGLPFFVLGIVYFVMGINAMKTKPAKPKAPEQ